MFILENKRKSDAKHQRVSCEDVPSTAPIAYCIENAIKLHRVGEVIDYQFLKLLKNLTVAFVCLTKAFTCLELVNLVIFI